MKHRNNLTTAAIAFAMVSVSISVQAENIIRQTQLSSGLQYDQVTDNDSGTAITHLPIEEGGASYELFARGSAWDENLYFLDSKIVGHYMPEASIEITTDDWINQWFNGNAVPRTRADQPYRLAIRVSGLLEDDPDAPAATKQVLYTHVGQNFNASYVPGTNGEYTLASFLLGNSEPSYTPIYTSLTPMAPTKAMGVETFTVSSLSDEEIPAEAILAEEMVMVWPISEAFIQGVQDDMVIRDSLPDIVVNYKDLYPLSMTYMQIYEGPPVLGTVGQEIPSTNRFHNTTVPQNEIIAIENWETLVPRDGIYTIEVLSVTPFDGWQPERLSYVSFEIDRHVNINSQTVTSEK